jgi:hypothetical protein
MNLHCVFMAALLTGMCLSAVPVYGEEGGAERVSLEKALPAVPFTTSAIETLRTTPDFRHVAWIERKGSGEAAALDGKRDKAYESIFGDSLRLSRDGKHFGYVALSGMDTVVVVDGKESPVYSAAGDLALSPDGKRTAWWAVLEGKAFAVVNGKPQKTTHSGIALGTPLFSADGKSWAYGGNDIGKAVMVRNGRAKKAQGNKILKNSMVLSPDGRKAAYGARAGMGGDAKWFVVVGTGKGRSYDEVAGLRFCPEGKRTAYAARNGSAWCVVTDKKEGKKFGAVVAGSIHFGPEGKRVGFTAEKDGAFWVVVDGKASGPYDAVTRGAPVFGPSGNRVAFGAVKDGTPVLVTDGVEEETEGKVVDGLVTFDPEGKRVVYAVSRDAGDRVVVDGEMGKAYDHIVRAGGGGLAFDGPSKFRYLVWENDAFLLVTEEIK